MQLPTLVHKITLPKQMQHPAIDPVPSGVHRPFWSVMIPTYNRIEYLEKALKSVLAQDPGPEKMQIAVVDNCSTQGDPEALVRKIAGVRVSFYRNHKNLGLGGNLTACIRRSHGHWVHIMHDDDVVLPGFYTAYEHFIDEHPEVVMIFSRAIAIDENDDWSVIMHSAPQQDFTGIVKDAGYELGAGNYVVAPTTVLSRQACEKVGGFPTFLKYLLDWEMWGRLAALGPIGYIHQPYFLYRLYHSSSESTDMMVNGAVFKEALISIEMNVRRLPVAVRRQVRDRGLYNLSEGLNGHRARLHAKGEHAAALRDAVWVFKLNPSAHNLLRIMKSTYIASKQGVLNRRSRRAGVDKR